MNNKEESLNKLKDAIIADGVCVDLANQATQLVMGHGNSSAKIVFIGEAPGKKEDETGLPFQGAAGKRLDAALEEAGIDRSDVYITNIVKYRPPNNRDPKDSEKEAFWPYLLQELDVINPKIIITLGRHSLSYFLPDASIGEVHGTVNSVDIDGHVYKVAPMYHPAATIYNQSLKQVFIDDLKDIVNKITPA